MNGEEIRKEQGITLVALVITIIIIIILATVTMNMVFGDNGLIKQAQLSKDMASNSSIAESEDMNTIMQEYANVMAEDSEIPLPDTRSEIKKAKDDGTVFDKTTTLTDEHGNEVTVPGGFKIPEDSGDTVQQGIVIEDVNASTEENVRGSQYVWIPVGTFIKDDGSISNEIVLGRYTFDEDGTPQLHQAAYTKNNAENYKEEVVIEELVIGELVSPVKCVEKTIYTEGIEGENNGENATAKDLSGFVNSVRNSGGYYLARYEASYASGASNNSIEDYSKCKAASKISTSNSDTMNYSTGTLWNNITQIDASKVAINTYSDSIRVKSDLINSYSWDTAIVYIQEATGLNYSNQVSVNTERGNTGNLQSGLKDEMCKINNMASNIDEWTTEHSNQKAANNVANAPCMTRGGIYTANNRTTEYRGYNISHKSYECCGFRVILYI